MSTPADLSADTFEPLQGSTFSACAQGDTTWPARLVAVHRLGHHDAGHRAPFSLLFRGPAGPVRPQQIYCLQPEGSTAPMELFLVPVAADAAGVDYEAVFA